MVERSRKDKPKLPEEKKLGLCLSPEISELSLASAAVVEPSSLRLIKAPTELKLTKEKTPTDKTRAQLIIKMNKL